MSSIEIEKLPLADNYPLLENQVEKPRLVLPKREETHLVRRRKKIQHALLKNDSKSLLQDLKKSSFRVNYKFAFLLETMGYSAPHPRTAKEKAALDQFFSTVQHFAITQRERSVFIELWQAFDGFCREQHFTYFLFFGSLLGAFRHHAMVPWDDDLDLLMPESDMGPLIVLLKEHAELESVEQSFFVHRVFFRDRRKSLPRYGEPWSWPYLELHFYRVAGGLIKQGFNSCPKAKEADFFPLTHVPFEGYLAPVPRCMDRIVLECYKGLLEKCCTKNYDHRRGIDLHYGDCVKCKLLTEIFPFVTKRTRRGEGEVEEKVTLNGSLQATRYVKKGKGC